MYKHLMHSAARLLRWSVFPVFLFVSGCATNHVHPDFEQRLATKINITGLIVMLESTGLEHGGFKHTRLAEDEFANWAALHAMMKLFPEQQMQQAWSGPTLYLPGELTGLGYQEGVAGRDTALLANLLKSAVNDPGQLVLGEELEAVQRLAVLSGGDLILLGEIHTARHMSDESRTFGNFLSILAAAGGQYGVAAGQDTARSKWILVDPVDGKILRALEDSLRQ